MALTAKQIAEQCLRRQVLKVDWTTAFFYIDQKKLFTEIQMQAFLSPWATHSVAHLWHE